MGVERQALPQMVFPRMIAPHITMEVKIGGFEETSEQGNCRSKCAEPAHREPFYKSLPGKANHLEVEFNVDRNGRLGLRQQRVCYNHPHGAPSSSPMLLSCYFRNRRDVLSHLSRAGDGFGCGPP